MAKNRGRRYVGRGIIAIMLGVALAAYSACSDSSGGNHGGNGTDASAKTGTLTLRIGKEGQMRTILPELTKFAEYRAAFISENGENPPDVVLEGVSVAEVVLEEGNWTIIVTGFVASEDSEDAELVATARGSGTANIVAGKGVNIEILLDKLLPEDGENRGEGWLSWDIAFPPAIVNSARIFLSEMDNGGDFIAQDPIDLMGGEQEGRNADSIDLKEGYYRVDIQLLAENAKAGRSEVVYIYPHLETRIPAFVFTEADFLETTAHVSLSIKDKPEEIMDIQGLSGPIVLSRSIIQGYDQETSLSVPSLYGNVECAIDGETAEPDTGGENAENEGKTWTLRAEDFAVGKHSLTVVGIKDGVPHEREITFTVISSNAVNGAAELAAYLASLPENTAEHPYAVELSGINLSGTGASGNTLVTMYNAISRYVGLDLSGCFGETYTNRINDNRSKIISITLPDTIKTVDLNAFSECAALTSAVLPKVTTIGHGAFYNCKSLAYVLVPEVVSLPNASTSSSSYGAFQNCSALAEISLPKATSIQNRTFYGCSSLTSLSLPLVTEIGENAFKLCAKLAVAALPKAAAIGNNAFADCAILAQVILGGEPPVLGGSGVFPANKPIDGIYVPVSALETYLNTEQANWAALKAKIKSGT
jgi:hypothetical protein